MARVESPETLRKEEAPCRGILLVPKAGLEPARGNPTGF